MAERMSEALATNVTPAGIGILLTLAALLVWLWRGKYKEFWPLLGLWGLFVFNFLFSKNFLVVEFRDGAFFGTPVNILNQGSEVMLLGIGMTLVIAVKGIDLSVGSVMALSGALCVVLMKESGYSFYAAALIALSVSVIVGLLNGVLVAGLDVQPIVATLITMVGIRGVAMLVTGAEPVSLDSPTFAYVGTGHLLGIPFSIVLVLLVFAVAMLLSRKTALGLFMESTGDNETAARLAGVPTHEIKFWLYGFCGFCAGVAGLIAASYISTADPDRVGRMRELDAIFAVVIGGTALSGGRFHLAGTLLGALLIQTLSITMYNQHVASEIEPMPKAVVILVVCLLLSPQSRKKVLETVRRFRWPKSSPSSTSSTSRS